MSIGFALSAETGVIETREANNPSGKILTMEETILSRELAPADLYCRWFSNDEILMHKQGNWITFNINTKTTSPYKPSKKAEKVYTKGKSLYHRTDKGLALPIAVSKDDNITYGQYVSRNEFGINEELGANKVLHFLYLGAHGFVTHGYDNLLQWLTHTEVALLAQAKHHGANLLRQLHTLLKCPALQGGRLRKSKFAFVLLKSYFPSDIIGIQFL